MTRLAYKVAIVTEATSDFGALAAAALAAEGAALLLTGADDEAGEALAASLQSRGQKAAYHRLEATDPLVWATLVDKIMRSHGHLDVLVNNGGVPLSDTIEDATAAQLRETLDKLLIAPFLGIKAVIPAMRQSGGGAIINIAANPVAGVLPLYSVYGAAKAALAGLTKTTAVHCAQRGYDIRVNTIHPGMHETALLTENALRSTTSAALHGLLRQLVPAPPQLHDFGETIIHLASDEAAHITGSEFFARGKLAGLSFGPMPAPGGI